MNQEKARNKAVRSDWHPADIVAALRKAGWSLRKLSTHHGYAPSVLRAAIGRPWPRGEELIAQAIGVERDVIWAGRAAEREALRLSGRKKRPYQRRKITPKG